MTTSNEELSVTLAGGGGHEISMQKLYGVAIEAEKLGGKPLRMTWLFENLALDILYNGIDADDLRRLFAVEYAGEAVDIIVQPSANRRKKLLIADMESTIIQQEMLDELAALTGQREKVAGITKRAMNGEIDFVAALRERVQLLKGQSADILEVAGKRISFMPGADALVATMKQNGAQCWLVSGGFSCFAQPIAQALGFDRAYANELVVKDGIITGEVTEPPLDKNTKAQLLQQACKEYNLSLADALVVGDGANDIPMLQACSKGGGLGVAYYAKPSVRDAVPHHINHSNLAALLCAQGYNAAQIVMPQ